MAAVETAHLLPTKVALAGDPGVGQKPSCFRLPDGALHWEVALGLQAPVTAVMRWGQKTPALAV